MGESCLLLLASLVLFAGAMWADAWDFSVFSLIQGGQAEFTWRSVIATLLYALAAMSFGLSTVTLRRVALAAQGMDPNAVGTVTLAGSTNYGCMGLVGYLLLFLSLPAALFLLARQFFAL